MLTYDDLARACRENDLIAEQRGLPASFEAVDVGLKAAIACAEQRAIRIAFILAGEDMPNVAEPTPVTVPMSPSDLVNYQAAVLDGIAIGLRAALNRDNP